MSWLNFLFTRTNWHASLQHRGGWTSANPFTLDNTKKENITCDQLTTMPEPKIPPKHHTSVEIFSGFTTCPPGKNSKILARTHNTIRGMITVPRHFAQLPQHMFPKQYCSFLHSRRMENLPLNPFGVFLNQERLLAEFTAIQLCLGLRPEKIFLTEVAVCRATEGSDYL